MRKLADERATARAVGSDLRCRIARGDLELARAGRRAWLCVLLACGAGLGGGCARGVHWRIGTFEEAHREAQRTDQLTLVYFRSWYLVECTEFEERVLRDPAVLAESDRMVCVPLDFDWDRRLAERWELEDVPAVAVVGPHGEVLAKHGGPLTKTELLALIETARAGLERAAPSDRSAGSGSLPPS